MVNDSNSAVVRVEGLRKRYGDLEAVRGVTFEIKAGEVFGLLGPNGAGKTSILEILEGLRPSDAGTVTVCGMDPRREQAALKERIGAQLQATVLPDKIRVEEALVLFAGFYRESASIEMLLERFGLREKRRTYFENLSGGQKQRLALALAMVNNPELILLDEPTVGLDAQLRRDIYALIERFREERRTVLLTTHYIEEAERLCDRVAIIDHGRVIANGTPQELKEASRSAHLEVTLATAHPAAELALTSLVTGRIHSSDDGRRLSAAVDVSPGFATSVVRALDEAGVLVDSIEVRQPSLDDVFFSLTGGHIQEDDDVSNGDVDVDAVGGTNLAELEGANK